MLRHETRPHPGTQGVAVRLLARSPPSFRTTSWPSLTPCNGRSTGPLATVGLLTGRASVGLPSTASNPGRGLPKRHRGSESAIIPPGLPKLGPDPKWDRSNALNGYRFTWIPAATWPLLVAIMALQARKWFCLPSKLAHQTSLRPSALLIIGSSPSHRPARTQHRQPEELRW